MNLLFPAYIDNTFRGRKLALVFFGVLVFLKVVMSVRSITNGDSIAIGDGIPLDTFPAPAAHAYLSLFAILGLSQLMLCLLCILALVRYRAFIPLLFALFLLEFLGRRLIFQLMSLGGTGSTSATIINLTLLALMFVGLALSLWSQRQPRGETVK